MSENYGYNPEEFEQFKVKKAIESKFPNKEEINESSEEAGSEENNALKKGKLETVEAHFKDRASEAIKDNKKLQSIEVEIRVLEVGKENSSHDKIPTVKRELETLYSDIKTKEKNLSLLFENEKDTFEAANINKAGDRNEVEFSKNTQELYKARKEKLALESLLMRIYTLEEQANKKTSDENSSSEAVVEEQSAEKTKENFLAYYPQLSATADIKTSIDQINKIYQLDSSEHKKLTEVLAFLNSSKQDDLSQRFKDSAKRKNYFNGNLLKIELIMEDVLPQTERSALKAWLEKEYQELEKRLETPQSENETGNEPPKENAESTKDKVGKKEQENAIALSLNNLRTKIALRKSKIDSLGDEEKIINGLQYNSKATDSGHLFFDLDIYRQELSDLSIADDNLKKNRSDIIVDLNNLQAIQEETIKAVRTKIVNDKNINNLLGVKKYFDERSSIPKTGEKLIKEINNCLVEIFLKWYSEQKDALGKNIAQVRKEFLNTLSSEGESDLLKTYEGVFTSDKRTQTLEGVIEHSPVSDNLKKIIFSELSDIIKQKPERDAEKYGTHFTDDLYERAKQLMDKVEPDNSNFNSDQETIIAKTKTKLREWHEYIESNSVSMYEKNLRRYKTVDSFLTAHYYSPPKDPPQADASTRRLNFLLEKKSIISYEQKKAEVDLLDKSHSVAEKEKLKAEIQQEYENYCEYIKILFKNIQQSLFVDGNYNGNSFQERKSGGTSKIIGKLKSSGEIELGLLSDSDNLEANIELNKTAVVGIKEGFNPITQRNKEGVGEGKLQTIVAEINDVLGNPQKYTQEYAKDHPEYQKYVSAGINSSEYNVDSMAIGQKGGEFVEKLMTMHREDLFKNEWLNDSLDDNDALKAYKQGIIYLASRNDLTSTNYIKLVGLKNKSLHDSCSEALGPFGMMSAQARALFKGDVGGYLVLSDSVDSETAITQDEAYQHHNKGQAGFYEKIKKIIKLYQLRGNVDSPQREKTKLRKHIFKPEQWHQGFVSRAFVTCSLGTVGEGENKREVNSGTYLNAAKSLMDIAETSIKPINTKNYVYKDFVKLVSDVGTKCSILSGLTGTSLEGELGHINQLALALFESFVEKILFSIEGCPRKNFFGSLDQDGRDYVVRFMNARQAIIDVVADPGQTKEPFRTKICEFLGASLKDKNDKETITNYEIAEQFMNEVEYTGIRGHNVSSERNTRYANEVIRDWPELYNVHPNDSYTTKTEKYSRYPKPVASVDPSSPFKSILTNQESK